MLKEIWNALFGGKTFPIKTFTYYISAPPPRKSGYREKNFDKVTYNFLNRGYRIISVHTESDNRPNQSGMWVLFVLQATNKESAVLDLETVFEEEFQEDYVYNLE